MSRFHAVADLAELDERIPKAVLVDGEPVALVRIGDEVFAVTDVCSHAEVALSDGEVDEDATLSCWLHGSRFDLRTGEPLEPPASQPVAAHRTAIVHARDGAKVLVALTEDAQERTA